VAALSNNDLALFKAASTVPGMSDEDRELFSAALADQMPGYDRDPNAQTDEQRRAEYDARLTRMAMDEEGNYSFRRHMRNLPLAQAARMGGLGLQAVGLTAAAPLMGGELYKADRAIRQKGLESEAWSASRDIYGLPAPVEAMADYFNQAFESLLMQAPVQMAGGLAAGPYGAIAGSIGVASVSAFNHARVEALDSGLDEKSANQHAVRAGLIEGVVAAASGGFFKGNIIEAGPFAKGVREAVPKAVLTGLLKEGGEEGVTEAFQIANDAYSGIEEPTPDRVFKRIRDAIIIGGLAGGSMALGVGAWKQSRNTPPPAAPPTDTGSDPRDPLTGDFDTAGPDSPPVEVVWPDDVPPPPPPPPDAPIDVAWQAVKPERALAAPPLQIEHTDDSGPTDPPGPPSPPPPDPRAPMWDEFHADKPEAAQAVIASADANPDGIPSRRAVSALLDGVDTRVPPELRREVADGLRAAQTPVFPVEQSVEPEADQFADAANMMPDSTSQFVEPNNMASDSTSQLPDATEMVQPFSELEHAKGVRAAADLGGVQAVGAKNLKAADKTLERLGQKPVSKTVDKITKDYLADYFTRTKSPVVGDRFTDAKGFAVEVSAVNRGRDGMTEVDYMTFPKKGKGRTSTIYTQRPFEQPLENVEQFAPEQSSNTGELAQPSGPPGQLESSSIPLQVEQPKRRPIRKPKAAPVDTAPVAEAVETVAKEPWQMTREELQSIRTTEPWKLTRNQWQAFSDDKTFANARARGGGVMAALHKGWLDDNVPDRWVPRKLKSGKESKTQGDWDRNKHPIIVENALAEGKPVPPEVLADYPDLAQKYAQPVAQKAEQTADTTPTLDTRTESPEATINAIDALVSKDGDISASEIATIVDAARPFQDAANRTLASLESERDGLLAVADDAFVRFESDLRTRAGKRFTKIKKPDADAMWRKAKRNMEVVKRAITNAFATAKKNNPEWAAKDAAYSAEMAKKIQAMPSLDEQMAAQKESERARLRDRVDQQGGKKAVLDALNSDLRKQQGYGKRFNSDPSGKVAQKIRTIQGQIAAVEDAFSSTTPYVQLDARIAEAQAKIDAFRNADKPPTEAQWSKAARELDALLDERDAQKPKPKGKGLKAKWGGEGPAPAQAIDLTGIYTAIKRGKEWFEGLVQALRKMGQPWYRFAKHGANRAADRMFNPIRGAEIKRLLNDFEGPIRVALLKVQDTHRELKRVIAKIKREQGNRIAGLRGDLTGTEWRTINAVLTGDAQGAFDTTGMSPVEILRRNLQRIHPDLRPIVMQMRLHLDQLSEQLTKMTGMPKGLVDVIVSNRGVYMNRSYQLFEDGEQWIKRLFGDEDIAPTKRLDPKILARAVAKLKQDGLVGKDGQPASDAEIANRIRDWMVALLGSDKAKGAGAGTGILHEKSNIGPEFRAVLGEREHGFANYRDSVKKMVHLLTVQHLINGLAANGVQQGWFSTKYDASKRHTVRMFDRTANPSEFLGPDGAPVAEFSIFRPLSALDGFYTTKETRDYIMHLLQPENQSGRFWTGLIRGTSLWKLGKTVLNFPGGHVRNAVSMATKVMGTGVTPNPKEMIHGFRVAWGTDPKYQAERDELAAAGVILDSVRSKELEGIAKDALLLLDAYERNGFGDFNAVMSQILSQAGEAWRVGDDAFKVVAYRHFKREFVRSGLNDRAAKAKAAALVRDILPTYSMIPESVKAIRRFPLAGDFPSWSYEIMRTNANQAKYALEYSRSDNPVIRGMGIKMGIGQVAGIAGDLALGPAIRFADMAVKLGLANAAVAALAGALWDRERDERENMAPWDANAAYWPWQGKGGEFTAIYLGNVSPYTEVTAPFRALLRPGSLTERVRRATGEVVDPYLSSAGFITAVLQGLSNNKNMDPVRDLIGGSKANPVAIVEGPEGALIRASYVAEATVPGTVKWALDTGRAAIGVEKPGRELNLPGQMVALAGPRVRNMKPLEAAKYRVYEFASEKSRLSRSFMEVYSQPGTVSHGTIARRYRGVNAGRQEAYAEMTNQYYTALRLGVDKNDLYKALRAANMSDDDIRLIDAGDWPVYLPDEKQRLSAAGGEGDGDARARLALLTSLYYEALESKRYMGRPYGPPENTLAPPQDRVPDTLPAPPEAPAPAPKRPSLVERYGTPARR
jgi:hypothetical protein